MAQSATHFNIPSQSLDNALIQWATQAHTAVSLPNNGLGDIRTAALVGDFAPDQALTLLLARSGYAFDRVGADAYRIRALPQRAAATSPPQDDVVTVTARRPTVLGALPRSITHLDAQALDRAGVTQDGDLQNSVAGLSFTNLGEGRDKIILRGVSDGALTGRSQSLVGLYFGDTRITYAAPDPDLKLVDIASVDVLRGPQGALYGAGAIGGVLRIEANPVDLNNFTGTAGVGVESTDGGDLGRNADLTLNAPVLRGRIGLRGVFYDEQSGGWLDNVTTNAANTNDSHRRGARVAALGQLSPHWSIGMTGISQAIDTKDSQYLERTGATLARAAAIPEPHDNDFGMLVATVHGEMPWAELTSTTSIIDHDLNSRFDATGLFADLGVTPQVRPLDEEDNLSILIQETRLASPAHALVPWVFGFFYADGDYTRDTILRKSSLGSDAAYQEHRVDAIDEMALFGEVTWPVTSLLSLSTGARVFQSRLSMHATTDETILGLQHRDDGHLTDSGVAPDVRLSFQPTHNFLVFVSAAQGYRSGGFNTGGPIGAATTTTQPFFRYDGDQILTYELGARTTLFHARLDLQAVAFANRWQRLQTDTLFANGFIYSGNVGNARAVGIELDARYRLTDAITLDAHAVVNEPELTRLNPSFPQATSGGLPGSPEFSASGSVRYEHALTFGALNTTGSAQLSAAFTDGATLGFGGGPTVDNYATVDLRFGLSTEHWRADLYAVNLTGSDGPTFSAGNPYQAMRTFETPLRPLTMGIALHRSF